MKRVAALFDRTPSMAWLEGAKRDRLIDRIAADYAFGGVSIDYAAANRNAPCDRKTAENLLGVCHALAEDAPLDIHENRLVLFSGAAKARAETFVNDNPHYDNIYTTLPGALLEMCDLFDANLPLKPEERNEPWHRLSRRLAREARGDITALIDTPKTDATFINHEMPMVLKNAHVTTLNGQCKKEFWDNVPIGVLQQEDLKYFKQRVLGLNS